MTTLSTARQAVRARLEAGNVVDRNSAAVPLRWQNEDADSAGNVSLPDTPSPFVYTEFLNERATLRSFGNGLGGNTYRNQARVIAYVFVPKGDGLDQAEDIAEQIAVLFRSYRTDDIFCKEAIVRPGGDGANLRPDGHRQSDDVGNYFYATTEILVTFDQLG